MSVWPKVVLLHKVNYLSGGMALNGRCTCRHTGRCKLQVGELRPFVAMGHGRINFSSHRQSKIRHLYSLSYIIRSYINNIINIAHSLVYTLSLQMTSEKKFKSKQLVDPLDTYMCTIMYMYITYEHTLYELVEVPVQ